MNRNERNDVFSVKRGEWMIGLAAFFSFSLSSPLSIPS